VSAQNLQPVVLRPRPEPQGVDPRGTLHRLHWYIQPLRRWAPVIIACVIVAGIGTYLYEAKVVKPVYQATATEEVVAPSSANGGSVLESQEYALTAAGTVHSLPVATNALALLKVYALRPTATQVLNGDMGDIPIPSAAKAAIAEMKRPQQLLGSTAVSQVADTDDIRITADTSSPFLAAAIPNAMAIAGSDRQAFLQSSGLRSESDRLSAQLATDQSNRKQAKARHRYGRVAEFQNAITILQTDIANVQAELALGETRLLFSNPAVVQSSSVAPHPLRSGVLAGFIVLVLMVGGLSLREYFATTLRTPDEVTDAVGGASVLGAILQQLGPGGSGPTLTADPRSPTAESLRVIRTNLLFSNIDRPPRIWLLTSGRQAEGKTTISSNLAASMAELGGRVLLIDGDLRRPSLGRVFGIDSRLGLTNALVAAGNEPLDSFIRKVDAFRGLSVMPSGPVPPNPAELLSSGRMRELLHRLSGLYDTIIIDSPPLLAVADPAILSTMVEAVILVADVNQMTLQSASRTRDALEQVGSRITGVVLNKLSDDHRGSYYYSYYYRQEYGYGYAPKDGQGQLPRPGATPPPSA